MRIVPQLTVLNLTMPPSDTDYPETFHVSDYNRRFSIIQEKIGILSQFY